MKTAVPKIITGSLLLAVVLSCWGSKVLAETGETYGTTGHYEYVNIFNLGNSNAGGRVYSSGTSRATHKGLSASEQAQGIVGAEAKFLGGKYVVLLSDADASASSTGTSSTWSLKGCLKIMGSTVSCPTGTATNAYKTVSSGTHTYSKTFFSASARFTIGPIPARVSGSVKGFVSGGSASQSHRYDGSSYSYDYGYAFASGMGGLNAYCEGAVGIDNIAEVGATLQVQLVDGSVSSSDRIYRYHYPSRPESSRYRYEGRIYSSADYSVGAGSLRLWATLWPFSWSNTVASWGGISGNTTPFNTSYSEYFAHSNTTTSPPPPNCGQVYAYGVPAASMNTTMPAFTNYCGACGIMAPQYDYTTSTYKLQCNTL